MIIVAFTSWPKRIANVSKVVFSLLQQTLKPDLIELNLSVEEFPNKEKDLPDDVNLLVSNGFLQINWVNENTFTFKKFIPTLIKHYGEDYFLITVDDDKLYNNDYVKFLIENIKRGDVFCASHLGNLLIGGLMVYHSLIFGKDFWEKLSKEIVETKVDDTYIQYYLKSKHAVFVKNEDRKKHYHVFNEIEPTRDYYLKENRVKNCERLSKELWI